MAKKKQTEGAIVLDRLVDAEIEVPIVGLTPVIPHQWSEKAKRMMPGHPDKPKQKQAKVDRNPEEEAEACRYRTASGDIAMPATAFKAATVAACRFFDNLTLVETKQLVFIVGDEDGLVPITGEATLREDTPRNSNGSADLRYRYQISNWTATLLVRFTPSIITANSVINLVDAGGRGGVGDWRPSAPKSFTGTFGQYRVSEEVIKRGAK